MYFPKQHEIHEPWRSDWPPELLSQIGRKIGFVAVFAPQEHTETCEMAAWWTKLRSAGRMAICAACRKRRRGSIRRIGAAT